MRADRRRKQAGALLFLVFAAVLGFVFRYAGEGYVGDLRFLILALYVVGLGFGTMIFAYLVLRYRLSPYWEDWVLGVAVFILAALLPFVLDLYAPLE
jgi:hypothetical protein